MSIDIRKFVRKPIYVEGVEVTAENMDEVAKWCNGKIRQDKEMDDPAMAGKFIAVKVTRPQTPRQTKAFVGDYVLSSRTGYKVYSGQALAGSFNEVTGQELVAANQAQEDYRSAETGQFVSEDYAEHNQSTTVHEGTGE